jgi:hypothetical protein
MTPMSNRNPIPVQLGIRKQQRVKDAIKLVTAPDSAEGVHVTETEHAFVRALEQDRRDFEWWVESFLAGVQLIRVGFDAPAFQRTLGEMRHARDTGLDWDETELDGMRN